ncbi:MAG: hypothetical protein M3P50_14110 [Actinomycetota bacterium]|nr:hypothetical protein [Actinomycetota bacterium]
MSGNPFAYQGPVRPAALIDRRTELDALQRAAATRVAIRLVAPRRFGKTSVLDAHVEAMRAVGHRALRIDLSRVGTVADVAARVAAAYAGLPADPGRAVRRWAARLGVEIGVGGAKVVLGPAARQVAADDARAALLDLLEAPARLHAADGDLTVVCLDEFQDLLVADDGLDGLLRSVIQHHGDAVAYVYAGSQPTMMRALFGDRERPFYGQARPLGLPPLPVGEASEDMEALLREHGLDPGDAVDRILAFTRGHPQRSMLLGHHLFEVLDTGTAGDDPAAQALDAALAETADAHQAVWDGLPRPERIVALGLADAVPPTSPRLADEHRIARSTLQAALRRLEKAEQHVVRGPRGPELLDPLLGEWLRRR